MQQYIPLTDRIIFKELMNIISQPLLCLRVSSQQVSCKGEGSTSGLLAGQYEPNSVCYNLSLLKPFLRHTVTGINHQMEEVLTLQTRHDITL